MDIALLVHTSNEWSRRVLMGVAHYGDDQGGWEFLIPQAKKNGEIGLPKNWNGDGIICRPTSPKLKQEILDRGLPCVNVSWLDQHTAKMPKVVSCELSCAEAAVNFLLEKQFNHFGFIGFHPKLNYSDDLIQAVASKLDEEKKTLDVFPFPENATTNSQQVKAMETWLRRLAKPCAVISWTSLSGQLLTRACQKCDLNVPEDVAILCVEHDHLFSTLAPVPLTNLDQDPSRVGYTAAKLLHEMISGEPAPTAPIRIPPISVIPRMSTDVAAVDDRILATALRYIYENAKKGITVSDVVKQVDVSRRALENKFQEHLRCSPGAYIKKTQLQFVARLLRTTKLTNAQIAIRAGFDYPEVMMRAFKKEYNMTPRAFRNAGAVPG